MPRVLSYPHPMILVHISYVGANDFSLLASEVLTIPSTAAVSTAVCLDITVPGDMMVEDNETFTISVETSNPNDVIMGPNTATITIVDNDSKEKWSHRYQIKVYVGFLLCSDS